MFEPVFEPFWAGVAGFGNQGRAKIMITPETGVKFENVAGIDEAKEELMEIVDFLKALSVDLERVNMICKDVIESLYRYMIIYIRDIYIHIYYDNCIYYIVIVYC